MVLCLLLPGSADAQNSRSASPPSSAARANGSAPPAAPATPEEEAEAHFVERDRNKDGWLSGNEIAGVRHYDVDGDGEVTRDEFLGGRAGERVQLREGSLTPEDIDLFNSLDSTGSGYISGVDIEAGRVGDFDADKNGRVTREEFYEGRSRLRREIQLRALAAREAEARRRLAAGEPVPPPPLDEVLRPKRGMMRGRVLTPDGRPVDQFVMEIIGYDIDERDPRIDGRATKEPNFTLPYPGRGGYYEVRLPDRSFGFAASITIPTPDGMKTYPLRTAGEQRTIDYIEVDRAGEGVVKNLIWDPAASEIVPPSSAEAAARGTAP